MKSNLKFILIGFVIFVIGIICFTFELKNFNQSRGLTSNFEIKQEVIKYPITNDQNFRITNENTNNNINLYKITIKENMPAWVLSNIIFYDNANETLPVGMNLSTKVLIDTDFFEFALRERKEFKTNMFSNNSVDLPELSVKNVTVYEYELKMK